MKKWRVMALLVGLLMGCSDKSDDDTGDVRDTGTTSLDVAACDARSDPGLEMVPGSAASTTAPAIIAMDSPHTIVLSGDAGGWVRLTFPEAGTYHIHTGFAGVFRGLWADDGQRTLEPARVSEVCPDTIPEVFSVTVGSPVTYYMQLGPLSAIYFWVYVQPMGAGAE